MKKSLLALFSIPALMIISSFNTQFQPTIIGAWHMKDGTIEHVLIFQDGYFSYTTYDKVNRKFFRSFGGTFNITDKQLHANIEFDTQLKDHVGQQEHYPFSLSGNSLKINLGSGQYEWSKVDDGAMALAGNWRITGRMNSGQMQQMQRSPRKTLKLLSGTRFQWMAINTETKEFFGTGGGNYTFVNGKYTENIEFFSRDSTRVGASLTFDGSVENNVWTHKGLNSRGEPLHEQWTREKER